MEQGVPLESTHPPRIILTLPTCVQETPADLAVQEPKGVARGCCVYTGPVMCTGGVVHASIVVYTIAVLHMVAAVC
eukprot:7044292-Pyramimonas_sp.AAC.1